MTGRKRRGPREGTRDRMLDAAADLLRSEGPTSLTTVRITKETGIVQSGFYAHFKNPDHLQQELADRAGLELRELMAAWMASLRAGGDDLASLQRGYRELLDVFDRDRRLIDLFLRYRRSPSPLGVVLGHLHTQLRADFFQFLRERAGAPEVVQPHLGTVGMHADALVAALLGMAEAVVDGRVGDLDGAALELASLTLLPLRSSMGR